ncbi:MAG: UDP-3-O-(3-hydroxymyristoyl)glucosamine N-acyltransferase [Acidobacteriota bacterium]
MLTLAQLAEIIQAEIIGEATAIVHGAQAFEAAQAGDVTLASDTNYRARLNDSMATAIIIAPPVVAASANLLVVKNPKLAFARAIQALHAKAYAASGVSADLLRGEGCVLGDELSIHPRVTLGRNVVIGNRVTLHPGVVIGEGSRIGDDTVIHANVAIYPDTLIGNRVVVHSGTVIGADGFGFVPDEQGRQVKLLQLGRVIIEDDCEIGANCAIDCGNFEDTILHRGVKLDNFIQVGHATEIGENTVVAALSGFSGGTRIGRNCLIAGQSGTKEHVTIGDRAVITAKTAVIKDVPPGVVVGAMLPAQEYHLWLRSQALFSKLPDIYDRLKKVEKALKSLSQKGN